MPTELHDCTQYWFDEERIDMLEAGYLTSPHAKILRPNVGTGEMRAFQTLNLSVIDLV